jgi:adenosylcobinamide-phosphate synthase
MTLPDLSLRLGLLAAALLIDGAVGYPQALYRRIGHPVTWIGALISWLDRVLNVEGWGFAGRKAAGVLAVLVLMAVAFVLFVPIQSALATSWPGLAALALLASTLSAARSLDTHVTAVANALETGGLPAGRVAVAQIVGRDPDALDEAGVCRAAIESLAENFSDGVVAPALWFAIGGLPGMLAYKAINTADSMIGHRTPRHEAFGWAAARLDDLVNLPASRLSGVLLTLAACVLPGASPRNAIRAVLRDAHKHRSPNAGWPEAAMAGALGTKIAGPRAYHGAMGDFAYMGDGRAELTAADIRRSLTLYRLATAVGWGIAVAGLAITLI